MVPNGLERRHRIQDEEVPEVIAGLRLRLKEHLKAKDDLNGATFAFKTLYRLEAHKVGKPARALVRSKRISDYIALVLAYFAHAEREAEKSLT